MAMPCYPLKREKRVLMTYPLGQFQTSTSYGNTHEGRLQTGHYRLAHGSSGTARNRLNISICLVSDTPLNAK